MMPIKHVPIARNRMKQRGIIPPIAHDRSEHSDSAYSGWVLLPDDRVFVVTYIVDDAPMAQIRGYWLEESLF